MLSNFLERTFWSNRVQDYLIFLLFFLGAAVIIRILEKVVLGRLRAWAKRTSTTLDDFAINLSQKILLPLLYYGAFYLSVNNLTLLPELSRIFKIVGVALLAFLGARFATELVTYGFKKFWIRKGKGAALERSLDGISRILKVIIWGLAVVLFLDNLGFKVASVIAGLGIGGVAVALAAQAVLKDLFSYFAIIFDRPFEVDDFIIVGDYLGVVEYIGIKTTRLRSLSGEQLIFSNTDLTDSRVRNYKRMEKRRVVFKFGVTYQTPLEKLREIPEIVKAIVEEIEGAVLDRAHFFSYGDFSLVFEVVYYVLGSDYTQYMDIQQKINLGLKKEFETRKIEFAYPTQTLYVSGLEAKK